MASPATDRYVLGPAIAAGGMGQVHIGRIRGAEGFSRIVAIKCLRSELAADAEHVAMFIDEAMMASRIRHVNVVPTLDVCRQGPDLWIVMEYVAGDSLAALLRGGALRPDAALAIFHDALAGLDGAHTATDAAGTPLGLVHRDVSPQNILVGADGVARIADFGIAKARNRAAITKEGEFKGKIGYAPPEIVQGFPATERADVYSTAVTLWEALVGQRLFVGENESTVLYKVLEWTPPLVSAAAPNLGTIFDGVVARALAKDPEKRFATAREMLDAVDSCGKRATAREVARLLQAGLGERLQGRAQLVRSFEAGIDSSPALPSSVDPQVNVATRTALSPFESTLPLTPPATVSMIDPAKPGPAESRTSGAVLTAAAIVVALVVATTGVMTIARRWSKPATAPAASIPSVSVPVVSSTTAEPAEAESVARPLPAASSAPRPARTKPSPVKPSCDPPYAVDTYGDKHYKPECFK